MAQNAYILRIAPGGMDRVPEALRSDQLIIGWAQATGLLDESLTWDQFRRIIKDTYCRDDSNLRKAGAAAGHMWRFLREMKTEDLVVVPYGSDFYVAEIAGPAEYFPEKIDQGSAYRRPARWLNNKQSISRQIARSALLSRMKVQGTSADASDLLGEIKSCLEIASRNEAPTFQRDLQARLVREVLSELRNGRIESFGFERLIQTVLITLGAAECKIIPRNLDKGADLIATFQVAGAFQQRVAVQAKHWHPDPPVGGEVVEQLISGIEAEAATLGMVITSGSISEEAAQVAQRYLEDSGIRIELVDGEQFAKLIVEHGIVTS
ncbi:MAG TPA: restriction endonuclease [Rhodanobacteraceae bacterium]|nr:restriction endonuclease [Rhodanobacteraceae bacterium]